MPDKPTALRVGVLLDSLSVPAWIHRALDIIASSEYADIVLVVLNRSVPEERSLFGRMAANRSELFYRTYMRLEKILCRPRPDAFRKMSCGDLLKGADVIDAVPGEKGGRDFFTRKDVEAIRSRDLDVIVRFGFNIVAGEVLQAARWGVWSFEHSDRTTLRGNPAGFWEVFLAIPTSGAVLQVLGGEEDDGKVLARTVSSTNRYSVVNSRNKYFWNALSMLPRKLRELHELGGEEFFSRAGEFYPGPQFYDGPKHRVPGNVLFASSFAGHALRTGRGLLSDLLTREDWILMYRFGEGVSTSFRLFGALAPPRDRLWADPHVVENGGMYYIFFEELVYREGKGRIAVIAMDGRGSPGEPVTVLEAPHHLAYPMVFQWEGAWYMTPDSSSKGSIDLYRCDEFPYRWSFHRTLMSDISAADPTVLEHGGKWWLFASLREHAGASLNDELFLFSAENPVSGTWKPHPLNPVVSNARKARPAGRFLEEDGKIFRLSQNCTGGYGAGMNLHEIITLDGQRYRERDVSSLGPRWDRSVTGLHTLTCAGGLTVIDAKVKRMRFSRRTGGDIP